MSEAIAERQRTPEARSTTKWILATSVALASSIVAVGIPIVPGDRSVGVAGVVVLCLWLVVLLASSVTIVGAGARVLMPAPQTLSQIYHYLDENSTAKGGVELASLLNESGRLLLPARFASPRLLLRARIDQEVTDDEFDSLSRRIVNFVSAELGRAAFRRFLRRLAFAGTTLIAATFIAATFVYAAPRSSQFEWLNPPLKVAISTSPEDRERCSLSFRHGWVLAESKRTNEVILSLEPTAECVAESAIVGPSAIVILGVEQ